MANCPDPEAAKQSQILGLPVLYFIAEKIVKTLVLSFVDGRDPQQFACQAGRGVEDANLFILNGLYEHLEKPEVAQLLCFCLQTFLWLLTQCNRIF